MKRSTKIGLTLLGILVLTVVVVVANVARSRSTVRGIVADVRYGKQPPLIANQSIVDTVTALIPDILHQQVRHVDRQRVAAAAAHVPFLTDVTASVSVSGRVVVKASQRRPIARLFHSGAEYYFDADGVIFPTSRLADCNVRVASGDFLEPLRPDSLSAQMQALVSVARFLDRHEQYGMLIDQIHVERDGDIMLTPKLGDHIVELGSPDNLDTKFANLLTFYRRGMPRTGWQTYSKVSLKFDGQVVCTKKKK